MRGEPEITSPKNVTDSVLSEVVDQALPSVAPQSKQSLLRVDVRAAMQGTRPLVRQMAETAVVPLEFGARTQEQRLAEAIASTEKRDCLGPRADLSGDLVQLVIYLHTIAAGKCKGQ